jgi:hypothetical protein
MGTCWLCDSYLTFYWHITKSGFIEPAFFIKTPFRHGRCVKREGLGKHSGF